jgi:hypothetical protein
MPRKFQGARRERGYIVAPTATGTAAKRLNPSARNRLTWHVDSLALPPDQPIKVAPYAMTLLWAGRRIRCLRQSGISERSARRDSPRRADPHKGCGRRSSARRSQSLAGQRWSRHGALTEKGDEHQDLYQARLLIFLVLHKDRRGSIVKCKQLDA